MPAAVAPTPELHFDPATHRYVVEDRLVLSVTQILKMVGLSDSFEHVAPDVLERKRAIGQAVHQATHYFDEGDLNYDTVDPEVQPYLRAYILFKQETGFEPVHLETRVLHPAYRYAGTFDRLGLIRRHTTLTGVLCDLKTGDPRAAAANLQTAGYLEAYQQAPLPMPPITRIDRWSVQLHPTGRYSLTRHTDLNDRRVFLAAVAIANYKTFGGAR